MVKLGRVGTGLCGAYLAIALPACTADPRNDTSSGEASTGETTGGPSPIDVDDAEPQDTPIPTGDANAADLPQLTGIFGPAVAKLGQVVTLTLTTDFDDIASVTEVALALPDDNVWYRVPVEFTASPESVNGRYQTTAQVAVASNSMLAGSTVGIELALLLGDEAGGFQTHNVVLSSDVTACPADAECGTRTCGADPLCGTSCGACSDGLACTPDGACEAAQIPDGAAVHLFHFDDDLTSACGDLPLTATGTVLIDTNNKAVGTSAAFFDDDLDNLHYALTAGDLAIGQGEFTLEFWMRGESIQGPAAPMMRFGDAQTYVEVIWDGTRITARVQAGGVAVTQLGPFAASPQSWQHVALQRRQSQLELWYDGQLVESVSSTDSLSVAAPVLMMGGDQQAPFSGSDAYHGRLDELRLTVGTAVFSQAFVPEQVALSCAVGGG